jgi:hypothetical protein
MLRYHEAVFQGTAGKEAAIKAVLTHKFIYEKTQVDSEPAFSVYNPLTAKLPHFVS